MEAGVEIYKDGYIKSEIALSIGILVSNHVQYMGKCMEALKPLLDNVKAELIVLDTIGPENSDGSIEICRKYTNNIFRFEWINDFAAARNELIKHSRGEWFMYLDDDEWFDDVTELVDFFTGEERHRYNFGCYYARNHKPDGTYTTCNTLRMIRRRPETCMIGRIHEVFSEKNFPGKQFSVFVHHMGYYYVTEEEQKKKIQRNLYLLDAEIAESGITPGLCAQKVQELLSLCETWDEGFRLSVEYTDSLIRQGREASTYVQWMISAQARYYYLKEDYSGVIKQTETIRKKYRLARFTELVLAYIEMNSLLDLGDVLDRLALLEKDIKIYLDVFEFFKKHPEEEVRETQLDNAAFIEPEKLNTVLGLAGDICAIKGDYDRAVFYWKGQVAAESDEVPGFKRRILEALERIDGIRGVSRFYEPLVNPAVFEAGNEKYIPKTLREKMGVYARAMTETDGMDTDGRIMYYDSLPIELFEIKVRKLVEAVLQIGGSIFDDRFLSALIEAYEKTEGPEYYCLLSIMLEGEIKLAVVNNASGSAIDALMKEYIIAGRQYHELLYQEQAFDKKTIRWLPPDCRYNDLLYRFLKNGRNDLDCLLRAAKMRPDMAKALSRWIGGLR